MATWKNTKKPPFADGDEKLNKEQLRQYVSCLSLEGLHRAAYAYAFVAQSVGMSPKEYTQIIELDYPPAINNVVQEALQEPAKEDEEELFPFPKWVPPTQNAQEM